MQPEQEHLNPLSLQFFINSEIHYQRREMSRARTKRLKRKAKVKKIVRAARIAQIRSRIELRDQHLLPPIPFDPNITFGPDKAAKKAEKATTFLYERLATGKRWRYKKKLNHLTDIPDFVHLLRDEGLIGMKRGYAFSKTNHNLTKIWPTPNFIKVIGRPFQMDSQTVLYKGDLIELRDEDKNPIPYIETKETIRIRKILQRINRVNRQYHTKYHIMSGVMGSLHTDLHAIFNQKLTWGGRVYTVCGDSYQNLSQKDRATIEIADEPTVELDYSGLHPRLLYAEAGIQYNYDPYDCIYETDDKDLRTWLKIILLGILNSKDRATATKAANKALKDSWKQCVARRITKKRTPFFLDRFEKSHVPIKHFFSPSGGASS